MVAQTKADVVVDSKMYISGKIMENLTQKNTHLLECDFSSAGEILKKWSFSIPEIFFQNVVPETVPEKKAQHTRKKPEKTRNFFCGRRESISILTPIFFWRKKKPHN